MSLPRETPLLADADLCVKCGLCLPHCPTYRLSRHEGDSPRGRIALWQGLAQGRIPLTEKTEAHLDGCLACGACEAACPAQVPYARIRRQGRALVAQHRRAGPRFARMRHAWRASVWRHRGLFLLRWIGRRTGWRG